VVNLIKYVKTALVRKPKVTVLQPKAVEVKTHHSQPNQTEYLKNGIAPSLSITKVFDSAPEMRGLFENYYGFDPANFAMMTPEMLGQFTDVVNQAKFFDEMLPTIEQHIKDYITAKVNHDKFVANCIKSGAAGMKSIDEATLQVFLEHKGYRLNHEKLGRKADNETIRMEADRDNFFQQADFTLQTALQIKAAGLSKSLENIEQRPILAAEQAQQRQITSDRKQQVKNLIQYGTRGK